MPRSSCQVSAPGPPVPGDGRRAAGSCIAPERPRPAVRFRSARLRRSACRRFGSPPHACPEPHPWLEGTIRRAVTPRCRPSGHRHFPVATRNAAHPLGAGAMSSASVAWEILTRPAARPIRPVSSRTRSVSLSIMAALRSAGPALCRPLRSGTWGSPRGRASPCRTRILEGSCRGGPAASPCAASMDLDATGISFPPLGGRFGTRRESRRILPVLGARQGTVQFPVRPLDPPGGVRPHAGVRPPGRRDPVRGDHPREPRHRTRRPRAVGLRPPHHAPGRLAVPNPHHRRRRPAVAAHRLPSALASSSTSRKAARCGPRR